MFFFLMGSWLEFQLPMLSGTLTNKREKLSLSTPLRHRGGAEAELHSFLMSAVDGGDWLTSRSCRFPPRGRKPRYPLKKGLCGPHDPFYVVSLHFVNVKYVTPTLNKVCCMSFPGRSHLHTHNHI